jgi:hypothetical protein
MSPQRILLGKLLGEPALAYLLAVASIPLAVWCWILGVEGVSLPVLLLLYVNLGTTTLLFGCAGLMQPLELTGSKTSTGGPGSAGGWGIVALIFLPQLVIHARSLLAKSWSGAALGLLTPIPIFLGLVHGDLWLDSLSFFGIQIPFLVVTPVTQLLLASVFFSAMVRRLINPLNTSLSKRTAYNILLVVDLLTAAALFEPAFSATPIEQRCAGFCLVHLFACLWLTIMVTPWRESLHSWVWRFRGRTSPALDLWLGERTQNILVLFTFAAIGIVTLLLLVALPASLQENSAAAFPGHQEITWQAGVTALLVIALGIVCQFALFVSGRTGTGVFLTFVTILVLPVFLFGHYYQVDLLMALSPIAYYSSWLSGTPSPSVLPLLCEYALLALLGWFAIRRRLGRLQAIVNGKLGIMGVQTPVR